MTEPKADPARDSTGDPQIAAAAASAAPVTPEANAGLERRASGLLLLLVALLAASALYLMYARGAFESTQRLVLVAEDSEGVTVGMDLTFSGFPIGRVRRIELGADGNARIVVEVPRSEAHWLRTSSVFTLSRGLVGGTALRAFSGILTDPPLPEGAERHVLAGDASAEVPKLMGAVRELLANLNAITAKDAALAGTLSNVNTLTGKLNEPRGALGVLMGNPADAERVTNALNRANALLARLDGLTAKADSLVGHADAQVFGPQGLTQETQATVTQLRALLTDARGTLQGVDKLLAEAQGVAANARSATADLGPLRAEVEASLRKVQSLVNELNRRWPLARDTEVKLP